MCVLVLLYSLLWPIGPLHKPWFYIRTLPPKRCENRAKSMRDPWHIIGTFLGHPWWPPKAQEYVPKAFNASDAFTRCLERLQMASNAPKSSQPCGLAGLSLCRFVCFCIPPLLCYACLCSCLALFFALTNWTSAQTLVLH